MQPAIFKPETRRILDFGLKAGESPVWDADTGDLWFVDITAPALLVRRASGKVDRFELSGRVGSLALCIDGRVLVALQSGVYVLDPSTKSLTLFCNPEEDNPQNYLNDGKVGPDGRFWIGSMNQCSPQRTDAGLYRVDTDGRSTRVLDGLITSNGLAWSPDGRTLYHSDSRQQFLQAFDFEPLSGTLSNRRHLRDFPEEDGRPDGAAMDVDGFYWSAGVSAGRLNRIAPDGTIVEIYLLPVAAPSMPCFGGPDMRTIYITSLSSDRTGTFEEGGIVAFEAPIAGVPVKRFGA